MQVKLLLMPFSRDVDTSLEGLSQMIAQLNLCASTRAFLCTSREHRLSLQLKAQVHASLLLLFIIVSNNA